MIQIEHLNKTFDKDVKAVSDFNLDVAEKEFIVFVGPSGCGKSTTLRMIAGLETITSGTIKIDGKVINDLHPKDREIAMVFQNYALYPHMTVYQNMTFGLKMRKMKKSEYHDKIVNIAKILEIEHLLKRKPKALSGGQRQRVALGRAIVRDAKLFLMDEPLSNLDAKLRTQMRTEIIKLHERVGATTIYVTHDQTEAMTMASRIVVMKDGLIQQIGTPEEIYNNPANRFVASFIGSPNMNFIHVDKQETGFAVANERIQFPFALDSHANTLVMGFRPENAEVWNGQTDGITLKDVVVDVIEMTGAEKILTCHKDNFEFKLVFDAKLMFTRKQTLTIFIPFEALLFFDEQTGQRIQQVTPHE
ncbi:ABC transporter ATP-binding protein [Macrococcus equi]|uniref:ABC transporter ATP-binding protein n=1 Tax=Macrococcus equi TaxID=3395462 RepID=UPI0039BDCFAA